MFGWCYELGEDLTGEDNRVLYVFGYSVNLLRAARVLQSTW